MSLQDVPESFRKLGGGFLATGTQAAPKQAGNASLEPEFLCTSHTELCYLTTQA